MTIWDCRTHVRMTSMTSSVERTDLDFKISVALIVKSTPLRAFTGSLYPPQNEVLGGYTVFSMSVIPSFRDSEIPSTFKVFAHNFDSFCQILFKFTPHLNNQTVHVW